MMNIKPVTDRSIIVARGESNLTAELHALLREREQWETVELAASNQRLYSILTKCYAYYLTMKSATTPKDIREQYKDALETFIKQREYRFKQGTSDMNKIVQCVFGIDRRRVSAYARSLTIAYQSGPVDKSGKPTPIIPEELANWIVDQGGIEEVRRAKAEDATKISVEERRSFSTQTLEATVLAEVSITNAANVLDAECIDKKILLVATYRPDGKLEVHGVVKSQSAVERALDAYYTEAKLEATAAAKSALAEQAAAQKVLAELLAA